MNTKSEKSGKPTHVVNLLFSFLYVASNNKIIVSELIHFEFKKLTIKKQTVSIQCTLNIGWLPKNILFYYRMGSLNTFISNILYSNDSNYIIQDENV